jgi:murein DD-endopeptidase MepM/ murein hydrolase activator NlpD
MFTDFASTVITRRRALFASISLSAALLLSTLVPQNVQPALAAKPFFQMPFRCGQVWIGSTRSYHNPPQAVDFNRDNDFGDAVLATANGTITTIANLGDDSYGRYMIISHGDGWSSLYAHLSETFGHEGQSVSKGTRIASVGNSGGSSGPHLHYEQRYNGSPVRIYFNGDPAGEPQQLLIPRSLIA